MLCPSRLNNLQRLVHLLLSLDRRIRRNRNEEGRAIKLGCQCLAGPLLGVLDSQTLDFLDLRLGQVVLLLVIAQLGHVWDVVLLGIPGRSLSGIAVRQKCRRGLVRRGDRRRGVVNDALGQQDPSLVGGSRRVESRGEGGLNVPLFGKWRHESLLDSRSRLWREHLGANAGGLGVQCGRVLMINAREREEEQKIFLWACGWTVWFLCSRTQNVA